MRTLKDILSDNEEIDLRKVFPKATQSVISLTVFRFSKAVVPPARVVLTAPVTAPNSRHSVKFLP